MEFREFERDLISQRTKQGLAAARATHNREQQEQQGVKSVRLSQN